MQKTAYEMRISDWSSDVCSSDLELVADDAVPRRSGAGDQRRLVDPRLGREGGAAVWQAHAASSEAGQELGRASCRERVCQYVESSVVDEPLKKKENDKTYECRNKPG